LFLNEIADIYNGWEDIAFNLFNWILLNTVVSLKPNTFYFEGTE